MSKILVQIHRMISAKDLEYPVQAIAESSGVDLRADVSEEMTLLPGKRILVPTGLKMSIPKGYEAQVRPRSGLALKEGITVLNSPGTIDAGYRGEIKVILMHHGETPFSITRGMRIAQLVFCSVVSEVVWEEVEALGESQRGESGFGSTGRG